MELLKFIYTYVMNLYPIFPRCRIQGSLQHKLKKIQYNTKQKPDMALKTHSKLQS